MRWPGIDVGRGSTVVPVTVLASSATSITTAEVVGAGADDFDVRLDECSGRVVPAAGTCQVWMRFSPLVPGDRAATLRLTDTMGAQDDVALSGFAFGDHQGPLGRATPATTSVPATHGSTGPPMR